MWVLRPESGILLPALFLMAWLCWLLSIKRNGWLGKIQVIFALDGETLTLESHVHSKKMGLMMVLSCGVQRKTLSMSNYTHDKLWAKTWKQILKILIVENLLKGRKHLPRRNKGMLQKGTFPSPMSGNTLHSRISMARSPTSGCIFVSCVWQTTIKPTTTQRLWHTSYSSVPSHGTSVADPYSLTPRLKSISDSSTAAAGHGSSSKQHPWEALKTLPVDWEIFGGGSRTWGSNSSSGLDQP